MSVSGAWSAMVRSIRNLGRPGIASMAIAAVDAALWDLKARLLDLPLSAVSFQQKRRRERPGTITRARVCTSTVVFRSC